MKVTITFKDPDALRHGLLTALGEAKIIGSENRDDFEDKFYNDMRRWFRYGEYVDLEIDTDAGTCIVKERK